MMEALSSPLCRRPCLQLFVASPMDVRPRMAHHYRSGAVAKWAQESSRLEVYGCPRKLYSKWLGSMGYNLLINGVYWGYNPVTNHLLTSWDIQDIGLL